MIVGSATMILWTKKGDIGRTKLTEIEEQTFGGDCRSVKGRVVKRKEHLPFSREFSILYIEYSVAVDLVV